MKMIYVLMFLLRNNREELLNDLEIARRCMKSIYGDLDVHCIVYNQGIVTNKNVEDFLRDFDLSFEVVGNGVNHGIPKAKQSMLEYIW